MLPSNCMKEITLGAGGKEKILSKSQKAYKCNIYTASLPGKRQLYTQTLNSTGRLLI